MIEDLFAHKSSETLTREQASFFIREAQDGAVEMGNLLQQINLTAQPDIAGLCTRLLQINSQLGGILKQLQKSLE